VTDEGTEAVDHRLDAEHLEFGGGLEILLAAALERVAPGGVLEIRTGSRAVALEMPGWARLTGHELIGESDRRGASVLKIRRGSSIPCPPEERRSGCGRAASCTRRTGEAVGRRPSRDRVRGSPRWGRCLRPERPSATGD
jgi:TusA-related sulfurtransferase